MMHKDRNAHKPPSCWTLQFLVCRDPDIRAFENCWVVGLSKDAVCRTRRTGIRPKHLVPRHFLGIPGPELGLRWGAGLQRFLSQELIFPLLNPPVPCHSYWESVEKLISFTLISFITSTQPHHLGWNPWASLFLLLVAALALTKTPEGEFKVQRKKYFAVLSKSSVIFYIKILVTGNSLKY